MFFGMMVTLLGWIAHKLVFLNKSAKFTSFLEAITTELWKRNLVLMSDFTNQTLERQFTQHCDFLTPPVAGALLHGAFPTVDYEQF
jgi:hypothetical protein